MSPTSRCNSRYTLQRVALFLFWQTQCLGYNQSYVGSGSVMPLSADEEFWLATLSSVVAAVAIAIPAILAYRESLRLRRAEWLHRLFQEYYSASTYRPIRQLLDETDGRAKLSLILSKLASLNLVFLQKRARRSTI